MAALKYSRQRESIKEFLSTRKDHPTADVIYDNIRQVYPRISLGTVYRNLTLLENLGEIQKIITGDGADRFDYNVENHHHFICTTCHSVSDLEMANIDHIMETASENLDGEIEKYTANFYGTCRACLDKKMNQ